MLSEVCNTVVGSTIVYLAAILPANILVTILSARCSLGSMTAPTPVRDVLIRRYCASKRVQYALAGQYDVLS